MTEHHPVALTGNAELIEASGVHALLPQIRPEWQSKNLIKRVERLLPVDPSSACQRIFNASIHDLRKKVVIAGLDIAKAAADQHKLPPIANSDSIENYSTNNIINLSYRMGLLSRPEWRRIGRAYDIRGDLEHEDDEYEAEAEDCLYIFKSCIEIVLSKDPIQVLKLADVKEVIDQPSPSTLIDMALQDFKHAPQPRQLEIYKFLIGVSQDSSKPDIVRQNSYNALHQLKGVVKRDVLLEAASVVIQRIGRKQPSLLEMRISYAAGILPYLKKAQIKLFFESYYAKMKKVGHRWTSNERHGELLLNLDEVGGLKHCPQKLKKMYVEWLVLCYIGETGGYGSIGRNRRVFYSNSGALASLRILRNSVVDVELIEDLRQSSVEIRSVCRDEYVVRRIKDIVGPLR